MIKKFPFSDKPNTACFTCCHILNGEKRISYISHDEDGYWQFLCGKTHTNDEARIVSLADILKMDGSVADVADMPCGYYTELR